MDLNQSALPIIILNINCRGKSSRGLHTDLLNCTDNNTCYVHLTVTKYNSLVQINKHLSFHTFLNFTAVNADILKHERT